MCVVVNFDMSFPDNQIFLNSLKTLGFDLDPPEESQGFRMLSNQENLTFDPDFTLSS